MSLSRLAGSWAARIDGMHTEVTTCGLMRRDVESSNFSLTASPFMCTVPGKQAQAFTILLCVVLVAFSGSPVLDLNCSMVPPRRSECLIPLVCPLAQLSLLIYQLERGLKVGSAARCKAQLPALSLLFSLEAEPVSHYNKAFNNLVINRARG